MSDIKEPSAPRGLQARWVFPVAGPPLRDGVVTIAGGRIVAVGTTPCDVPIEDLGNVALLPGLVNAHTHLEFSDLAAPIRWPGMGTGMGIVDWLRSVIEHRSSRVPAEGDVTSAISHGLAESVRCGVTTIGEIAQAGRSDGDDGASHCDGTRFLELIAPRLDRVDAVVELAIKHLQCTHHAPRGDDRTLHAPRGGILHAERGEYEEYGVHHAERDEYNVWRAGLSPHAPYTVHPELLARAAALSNEYRVPLAMHLAESREEIEFLCDQSGPFRDLLESRGAWDPAARPRGSRPLNELRALSKSHRALVIHGNYLDDEEIEFLARQRSMAVVYCPRTHAWFGHAAYPLEKLLAAGAIVALGTDSRASSPDLSLLAEMRHVARAFPTLNRATILELGTLGGARALGRAAEIGTLEPGKWANLAAIALPEDSAADPHELILDGTGDVVGTWFRGAATT